MFAIDSNSSRNMIDGEDCLAFLNISRTARSDSPTHFEIISGPLILIKFACASLAIALAKRVLPVPGAPNITIPLGGFMPKCSNNSGLVSGHSTDSLSRDLTSSSPPISSQVTSGTSTYISRNADGSISLIAWWKSSMHTSIFSNTSGGMVSSSRSISGR